MPDRARNYDDEDLEDFVTHNNKFIGWLKNWLGMPSPAEAGCGVIYDY
jgi:hypothetical protein